MMQQRGYAFFNHTADIGIRAEAPTLEELFVRMAQGLTELLVEDSPLQPHEARSIQLTADDAPSLLLKWLQELLFWFSAERFTPVRYVLADVTSTSLHGRIEGDRFDPLRHVQGREVKAITQHQLQVRKQGGMWRGQVVVDI